MIQFPFQTMDLEILNLHEYKFFPTNPVGYPLSSHLKGSQDKFDPDLVILETLLGLKHRHYDSKNDEIHTGIRMHVIKCKHECV